MKLTRKDMVQIIITGFLVIVLIVIIMYQINKRRNTGTSMAVPILQAAAPIETATVASGNMFAHLEEEAKKLKLKRDPFVQIPDESSDGFYLNGIVWDESKPAAIINNQIVQAGGRIDGFTVVEIKEDKVILSDGKETKELKVVVVQSP